MVAAIVERIGSVTCSMHNSRGFEAWEHFGKMGQRLGKLGSGVDGFWLSAAIGDRSAPSWEVCGQRRLDRGSADAATRLMQIRSAGEVVVYQRRQSHVRVQR